MTIQNTAELVERPQQVAVIDDDDSFRKAVSRLLQVSGKHVVGFSCAGEFLLDTRGDWGCIVLDMCMPGPSGLQLLDALARNPISPPVIFVTGYADIPMAVRAIKAGAVDFLTKPMSRERLLHAVDRAFDLSAQRRRARQEIEKLRASYNQLSAGEREVFVGVVNGKLNKQLAGSLGVCERSIKSSRARVMRKMHAPSFAGLLKIARVLDREAGNACAN